MAFRKKHKSAPTYDGGQGLCVGHRINGSHAYLSDATLRQHTLVVGKSSDLLVMRLVAQQIARGGGFIVLDSVLDREMGDRLAHLMALHGKADHFRLLNVDSPQSSHTYNPVGEGSVESLTARLLYPLMQTPEADFPNLKEEVRQTVAQAVETLQSYDTPRTLSRILAPLMASTDVAAQHALYRLMPFAAGKFGQVLDDPEPEVKLTEVLRAKQGLYVTLPTMGKDFHAITLGRMVLADLCSALEAHAREVASEIEPAGPPFLILIHDASLFLTAESLGLFEIARAAHIGVMAFESGIYSEPYWSADMQELMLSQTRTKLFLGAYARHDCSREVEMLAQEPPPVAMKWHGIARRRPITEAELKEMPLGKSVLKTDSEVERLEHPAMPDLGDVPPFRPKAPDAVQSIPTAHQLNTVPVSLG